MSSQLIGLFGVAGLLLLIFARVPVGVALGMVGIAGYAALDGWQRAFLVLGRTPFDLASAYSLSVLPLFILMGLVASHSGMARELFQAANALFSGRRGTLAMATIGACAGMGSISGSSLAVTATMSRVVVPEMRTAGYDDRLATGAVAAGGTLGILIPPSVMLVIYAISAEQSVPRLFAAGLVPGVLLALFQILVVALIARLRPAWTPASAALPWGARLRAASGMWKLVLIFCFAVGGIYAGWFSPTEAAAMGAFSAILIALACRQLDLRHLVDCLLETVRTSAMLFFILLGALLFGYFLVQARLPAALVAYVEGLGAAPLTVMLILVLFYLVLGCFLESITMLLITVPVFLPLVISLGYDPIWYGVFLVVLIEVGLITPPVGLNLFVLQSQLPDTGLGTIYRGVLPFLLANALLIALLLAWPGLALWLPAALY
jgi:tripartite ATP-independent transporter DctM subunit